MESRDSCGFYITMLCFIIDEEHAGICQRENTHMKKDMGAGSITVSYTHTHTHLYTYSYTVTDVQPEALAIVE